MRRRLEFEDPLVYGAKLLDVEIAVEDLRATAMGTVWRAAQRHDGSTHDEVAQSGAVERVGLRRSEQPAVERRHAKLAGGAAGVRQTWRWPERRATAP